VPVEDGVSTGSAGPGAVDAQVSLDGTMFYRPGVQTEQEVVLVDREGNEEILPSTRREYGFSGPRFSPDGRLLAIPQGGDIWLYDIERGVFSPFITHEASDSGPLWTPDGQAIIFVSNRTGNRDIYRVPVDGSEEESRLRAGQAWLVANSICSDGQVLLFDEQTDIWALPLDGDAEPEIVVQGEADDGAAVFSPDCGWLAYTSNESGRYEVYVRPYGRPGRREQVSIGGGEEPAWGADGREIFYRAQGQLMVVEVSASESFSAGMPKRLFAADYLSYGTHFPRIYDVSTDGLQFAFFKPVSDPPVGDMVVVLNWLEELKRLVPTTR
jgi:Tol biopolymer transport system component